MTHEPAHDLRCDFCHRVLDEPGVRLSEDMGGECLGCLVTVINGMTLPSLPHAELNAWLMEQAERERHRQSMVEEALADHRAHGSDDIREEMVLIAMQRLILDSMGRDEARHAVETAFSVPLPFRLPTIDELDG